MPDEYQNTSLWRTSLARAEDDLEFYRERLRAEYFGFRERAAALTSQIQGQLPGLTVHGITHLDALWGTASLLAGEAYPLNPLEGFVLGGAILLHDAALCFDAFEGGIAAVRSTVTWADAYAAECSHNECPDDERRAAADFAALRELHSSQAIRLIETRWTDPGTNETRYLINDDHLRSHVGQVIGQIAASHHWDIEDVSSRLPRQLNAPGQFPAAWYIDPIKIACLLRCADALHIDNNRAPDFLHALLRRNGISAHHWQAQNWLGRPALDISNRLGNSIVLTSTRAFPVTEAESWWVAYDAVRLAEKELLACNRVLDSRAVSNAPPFTVTEIRGVNSPESMSQFIRTNGWTPCSAELHVGNVERLVSTLGGEALYGSEDKLGVALREILQNSRDAICARRVIDSSFSGKIHIRVRRGQRTTISVEDDGVGMSKRVMTGPLLDFGSSFWASSLVRSEFPGLRSSGFRAVGRFGVGFYSAFMIADSVSVMSRRWDCGLDSTLQVRFEKGLSLRPLLVSGRQQTFTRSTCVTLQLKEGILPDENAITIKRSLLGAKGFDVDFRSYLSALAAGLDVDVIYHHSDGQSFEVHSKQPISDAERERWLRDISFADVQNSPALDIDIVSNAPRLRPIIEHGRLLGLAAISTSSQGQDFLSVATIGGLATSVHSRSSENFVGYIDHSPASAKRDTEKVAPSQSTINEWAAEQIQILQQVGLNDSERFFAACSLSHFNVDPRPIARVLMSYNGQMQFMTFDEVVLLLGQTEIAILKSEHMDHAEHYQNIHHPSFAVLMLLRNSSFSSLRFASPGVPEGDYSVIDCIYRTALERGVNLTWRTVQGVSRGFLGRIDALVIGIAAGEERSPA